MANAYIFNPESNRYVARTGQTGKRLLKSGLIDETKGPSHAFSVRRKVATTANLDDFDDKDLHEIEQQIRYELYLRELKEAAIPEAERVIKNRVGRPTKLPDEPPAPKPKTAAPFPSAVGGMPKPIVPIPPKRRPAQQKIKKINARVVTDQSSVDFTDDTNYSSSDTDS